MSLRRIQGKIETLSLAARRSAWCATSFKVARSTARRVSTDPTASISPIESTTTSTIATNRFVRSVYRRFTGLLSDGLVPRPPNRADQLRGGPPAAGRGGAHGARAGPPRVSAPPARGRAVGPAGPAGP